MTTSVIAALNLYPVKSCRGIALTRAGVAVRGLVTGVGPRRVGDREWMIVDGDGRFVTQREHPRLAGVGIVVDGDALQLSAPGRDPLCVPLAPRSGRAREVDVWGNRVAAHDAGDKAAGWLTDVIDVSVRLVRFDVSRERRCNPDYVGDSGAHLAFADGYPILVIGESSLADLNARLVAAGSAALPMNRFRPNVVIAGLEPYDEDHLDTIAVDGVVLKLVKPCTRCQITTTDQETAVRGAEPLAMLATYRNNARLGGVTFGMNAIVVGGTGGELATGASARCTFRF
jgi:uncharacterized protein YcbX